MRVSLEDAVDKLRNGEVVAIPTETVYGLAADARNDLALQKIFTIKRRPADHPLIVHIADISDVNDWAADFPEVAVKLAQAFWPGALTLVLPAKAHVSKVLRAGETTVALRIPHHPIALALLKLSGLCLAAPSANLFTQLSPTTAAHVEAGLGEAIPVLDGGACQVGIESTIVSVDINGAWQLLRPGMISQAQIAQVVGRSAWLDLSPQEKKSTHIQTPKVPGQHQLHYSPRTPLTLFKTRAALIAQCDALLKAGKTCAALLIGLGELPNCQAMSLSHEPILAAQHLYEALHGLDALKVDCLLVELSPSTPDWAAVLDRLSRAGSDQLSE